MSSSRAPESTSAFNPLAVPRFLDVGARWSWRLVVVAAAVYVAAWVLIRLRLVLIPLLVALLLAALLAPVVEWLARRLPRLLATWLTVLGLGGLLGGLGYLLGSRLAPMFSDLEDEWSTVIDDVRDWLQTGPLGLSEDRVDTTFEGVRDSFERFASGYVDEPASSARLVAELLGGFLLTLVVAFFFLKDGPKMWSWIVGHMQPGRREAIDQSGRAAFASLQNWIRGVAVTGAVDALIIGAALVVLGVPAAAPLIIITFFGAFFPLVGATVAGVLAAGVALAAKGVGTAVIVGIVVLVVQQVEGDVLMPLVMQRAISLHPVVVLVALAAGAVIGGVFGALVAVPLTGAVTAAISANGGTGSSGDDGDDEADDDHDGEAPEHTGGTTS